jgi:uncharacterized membrane protein YheB (UPF0754 family)
MQPALYFIPLIPAFICWFLLRLSLKYLFKPVNTVTIAGVKVQGFVPRYKQQFAVSISKEIMEMISAEFLQQKLTDAETLEKAKPLIESHIDNFLQHKLKTSLPVVAMFVGEKITAQLKELFMKELEELFPSIMSQFITGLSHNDELQNEIVVKLSGTQIETLEERFNAAFKKELFKCEFAFALAGLIAGIIQLVITIVLLK